MCFSFVDYVILKLFISSRHVESTVTLDSQLHRDYYTILHLPLQVLTNPNSTINHELENVKLFSFYMLMYCSHHPPLVLTTVRLSLSLSMAANVQ